MNEDKIKWCLKQTKGIKKFILKCKIILNELNSEKIEKEKNLKLKKE